jgi:hypothetical protein
MCTDQDAGSAPRRARGQDVREASARHEDGVGSGVDAPLCWHPLNRVKERR